LEWKNFEVVVSSSKLINVRNVMNDAKEKLDFRDRVIKTSVGFKYMIVATSSQCYIYRYLCCISFLIIFVIVGCQNKYGA